MWINSAESKNIPILPLLEKTANKPLPNTQPPQKKFFSLYQNFNVLNSKYVFVAQLLWLE